MLGLFCFSNNKNDFKNYILLLKSLNSISFWYLKHYNIYKEKFQFHHNTLLYTYTYGVTEKMSSGELVKLLNSDIIDINRPGRT